MRIKCLSVYPDEDLLKRLGDQFFRDQSFHITLGEVGSSRWGLGAYVQIESDFGGISFAPLELFKITDGRAPRFWEVRLWEGGAVTLWPPSFYRDYYHDDLSEEVLSVVTDFNLVRARMESEFS